VLLDALAVAGGVAVYFGVRGQTAGSPETALRHAADVVAIEQALGLDVERGLQSGLIHQESLTTFANWIYVWGHWPAIVITFIWLAVRVRPVFRRLRDAMLVSGLMGLCVYITYPVAPPRLANMGMVDTVAEQSGAYRVLQPPALVNQYAAMPSLHVGWDLLVGLAVLAAAGSWAVRAVGAAMPLLMAVATVLTANHYVLDVLVGAGFGLVGWVVAGRLERRRALPVPVPSAVLASPGPRSRPLTVELPGPRTAGHDRVPRGTAQVARAQVERRAVSRDADRRAARHVQQETGETAAGPYDAEPVSDGVDCGRR